MNTFNLEKALEGAAVITRDGSRVENLSMVDSHVLKGTIDNVVHLWDSQGHYMDDEIHYMDLVMKPDEIVYWINIYRHYNTFVPGPSLFPTKEHAEESAKNAENYIGTFSIAIVS